MLAAVLHGATDMYVEDRPEPALVPGEPLVAAACGGICGSDLSCFRKRGVGAFRLREPLTPGLAPVAVNLTMARDRPSRLVPVLRRVRRRGGRPGERADRRVAHDVGPFSPRQGRRLRDGGRPGAGDQGAPRHRPGAEPE